MKITKPSNDAERRFIINLITDDRFCKEIIPLINKKYFSSIYAREISSWCIEYYEQFSRAPKKDIQDIYYSKKSSIEDEETVDLLKKFLSSISKEYSESNINNIDYEIKQGEIFLGLRALEIAKKGLEDAIIDKDKRKGEQIIANFKRVERISGEGIDILHDQDRIISALTKERNEIIKFPGAVGKIIPPICRGDFMSYFGPAKRGKSFWLWYTAEVAMSQGNKVIYIPLEMNETAIIKRCWPSISGQPLYKRIVHSAHFELNEDTNKYIIIQDEVEKEGVDITSIENVQKKLRRLYRKGRIKIIPMVSATNEMIKSVCDNLEYYENSIPDVIVIDYADYMEPGKKYTDNRDKINTIWKGARDFANERDIAIVTASHTEKKTFESDIKTSQASEDIRKINHVTLAVSLNATKKENENNIIRLGMMEIREGRHITDQAVVLQCLDLGRPCIDSRLKNDVELNKVDNDEDDDEETKYKRK